MQSVLSRQEAEDEKYLSTHTNKNILALSCTYNIWRVCETQKKTYDMVVFG